MRVSILEMDLIGVVELLNTVADLCRAEAQTLDVALERFMGTASYDASALREDILLTADFLARTMGFPDSLMDPGAVRADYENCR